MIASAGVHPRQVVIAGVVAVAVGDPDLITAAVAPPTGEDDRAAAGREHPSPVIRGDVDGRMSSREPLCDPRRATSDRPVGRSRSGHGQDYGAREVARLYEPPKPPAPAPARLDARILGTAAW